MSSDSSKQTIRGGNMSQKGMYDFDRWRERILTYIKINPPNPSMLCRIDNYEMECFADTENLVRTFQIMLDSGEIEYIEKSGGFRVSDTSKQTVIKDE